MLLFRSLGGLDGCQTRARLRVGKSGDYEETQAIFLHRSGVRAGCTLTYGAEQEQWAH